MKQFQSILTGILLLLCVLVTGGCADTNSTDADTITETQTEDAGASRQELKQKFGLDQSMELSYATQFSVDYNEDGYALITVADGSRFFVVPKGGEVPQTLDADITVIQKPLTSIYLVATSAMDLFRAIDGLGSIRLSGTEASGWYIDEARKAMESGDILYAGKYSAPDYELILGEDCDLAIESTMIYHSPEVKEQLESMGIPVFVERSSYEEHPLGRMEWLKLYGLLLGKEEEAQAYFDEQVQKVESISQTISKQDEKQTVAFFYLNANGAAIVRKSGDYVAKMIELAGGAYLFDDLDDGSATSTMTMQMETFYAQAKDADVLIYNSTIDGEMTSLDELLEKSSLLADFKAVKEGNVWCVRRDLFQQSTGIGDMIVDIHKVLEDADMPDGELTYLYKLE
jgi:iron complex transport system substrate-binding protein